MYIFAEEVVFTVCSAVYRAKFTAGFIAVFTVKNGSRKVVNTVLTWKRYFPPFLEIITDRQPTDHQPTDMRAQSEDTLCVLDGNFAVLLGNFKFQTII